MWIFVSVGKPKLINHLFFCEYDGHFIEWNKKLQIDGVRKIYIILPKLEEAKDKWYEIQDSYTYEKIIDWRFKCSKV